MKHEKIGFSHVFSSGILARAIRSFDRATMAVVLASWGGAIVVMVFALYTLNVSVKEKQAALEAAVAEPALPQIVSRPPPPSELKALVDRLKKSFPDIDIVAGHDSSITVSTKNVNDFRLWMTVLSYIDTMTPQYRWTLDDFCVGVGCEKAVPMSAVLKAEKVAFATP